MLRMRFDSASSSGPSQGQCGAVKCRLSRNGCFDLGVAFDRLHPPVAEQVGHVAVPLDRHLLLVQLVRLRPAALRVAAVIEVVGGAAEDAEEAVVAALERAVVRQIAEMPFAHQARAVARLLEQRRQGRMARRQPDTLRRRRVDRLFQADRQAHLIAPGDQPGARRRAVGGIGIALREPQPLERQAVDVRRRVVALAVAAHVGIAEVVGEDEDDVRLGRLRKAGTGKAHSGQRQRARGSSLDEAATAHHVLVMGHCVSPLLVKFFPKRAVTRAVSRIDETVCGSTMPADGSATAARARDFGMPRWQFSEILHDLTAHGRAAIEDR